MSKNWFQDLFGFVENSYSFVQKKIQVTEDRALGQQILRSLVNGAEYIVGHFATPSLQQLRESCLLNPELQNLRGKLQLSVVVGDVSVLQALPENRFATFQVASQFNCLEFVSPSVTPEDGVERYVYDRTQGPACAISCGPATVFRNYFVKMPNGQVGQTHDCMINNLADFEKAVDNTPSGRYFKVSGGYTLATSNSLMALNSYLKKLNANAQDTAGTPKQKQQTDDDSGLNKLKDLICIGVHSNVQVTSSNWGCFTSVRERKPPQLVTQVLGSACSVSYSRASVGSWEPMARLVLEASYEATLWAAVSNALELQTSQLLIEEGNADSILSLT